MQLFFYRVDMAIIGHSGFFRPLQNAFYSIEFRKPVSVPETTWIQYKHGIYTEVSDDSQ